MAETLVIRLSNHGETPASWVLIDDAGNLSGGVNHGPLSAAAPLAAGRRVVAIVPGTEVLLAEPELPVRGGARLAQVVPFALEEQLADDLDAMHFAIGRREAEQTTTPVATVSRAQMDAWLATLREAQIQPQALYPDSALVPANPSQTVLVVEGDHLYVRHPQRQPFVLQVVPLAVAIEMAQLYSHGRDDTADIIAPDAEAEAPSSDIEPRHVVAYIGEDEWERHHTLFETMREHLATLNVQLLREGALPLFARQAVHQPSLNLLQGSYAGRSGASDTWRRWRVAAMLLAGLVALNLIGKSVELWRLKKTERSLDAAIAQTFREAMPGEQNTINARRRMESRLAAIRGGVGPEGTGIMPMLAAVGTAFGQVPSAKLNAFSFRNNTLDMQVRAQDVGSLSKVETLMNQGGMAAQLQSSDNNGSGVEGRVQVKGGKGGTGR